jgi:hypothetical protein
LKPCIPRTLLVAPLVGVALFSASPSPAQTKDEAAVQLADEAFLNEYLAMDFEGAVKKLQRALAMCEPGKCSPPVMARLHRDLGVVYVAGLGDAERGQTEFSTALMADPSIELDPDFATDAVTQAFNAAKGGGAAVGAEEIGRPTAGEAGGGGEVPESGDLLHVPPTEQVMSTPLPIYVEVSGGSEVDSLRVRYLPPTARDWLVKQLSAHDMGFGTLIDCADVGGSPGTLKYYIEGLRGGKVVAYSGTKDEPHRVAIKSSIDGDPPALPGEDPPAACVDEDCPPDFPGCGAGVGGDCTTDGDCEGGLVCIDSVCGEADEGKGNKTSRHHWIPVGFQVDLLGVAASPQVCAPGSPYTCLFAGNIQYFGVPDANNGNSFSSGGLSLATQRAMLGYEYKATMGLAVGARVGIAFGGAPTGPNHKFKPLHLEARLAYYLHLGKGYVEPYGFLSGGMAEVDAKKTVSLTQSTDQCIQPDGILAGGACPPPPEEAPGQYMGFTLPAFTEPTNVDAWTWVGNGFLGGGAGVRFLVKGVAGPYFEARANYALGVTGFTAAGQAGLVVGF